jgi:hypothetical protein
MADILLLVNPSSLSQYLNNFLEKKGYLVKVAEDLKHFEKLIDEKEYKIICFTEPYTEGSFTDERLNHVNSKKKEIENLLKSKNLLTEKIILVYDKPVITENAINSIKDNIYIPKIEETERDDWLNIGCDLKKELVKKINSKIERYNENTDKVNKNIMKINIFFTLLLTFLLIINWSLFKDFHNIKWKALNNNSCSSWSIFSICIIFLTIGIYWGRKTIFLKNWYKFHLQLQALVFVLIILIQGSAFLYSSTKGLWCKIPVFPCVHNKKISIFDDKLKLNYSYPNYIYEDSEEEIAFQLSSADTIYYSYNITTEPEKSYLDIPQNICTKDSILPKGQKRLIFPLVTNKYLIINDDSIIVKFFIKDNSSNKSKEIIMDIKLLKNIPIWLFNWWREILMFVISCFIVALKDKVTTIVKDIANFFN